MAQKGYIKNSLTKDLGAPEMANMFQGVFGASGIMSLYENLACVKVDNNTVRMSAGAYNLSGHLLGIAKGTTEDLTIDSGTSGQNRNDLVVAEFVRNGGGLGVDTLHFAVIKGTSTSGTAADPELTQQDINAAGVTRQEALYRVKVVGTEITAVEKVAGTVSNLNLVQSEKADWVRIDTLSSPLKITSTDYANPTIIPMVEDYLSGAFYAIELSSIGDNRSSQVVIFQGTESIAAGALVLVNHSNGAVGSVRKIRKGTSLGLYSPASDCYVLSVHKIS